MQLLENMDFQRAPFMTIVRVKQNVVLTPAEEQQLADWAVQMGRIGYGHTREQRNRNKLHLYQDRARQVKFVGGAIYCTIPSKKKRAASEQMIDYLRQKEEKKQAEGEPKRKKMVN